MIDAHQWAGAPGCVEGAGQDARFGVGSSAAVAASRGRSSMSGRTRMSRSAGMSPTRCRRTRSLPTSAGRATGTRIWRSGFWPMTGTGTRWPTGQNVLPHKHAYSHVNAMSSRHAGLPGAGRAKSICARPRTDLSFCARRRVSPRAAGVRTRIFASRAAAKWARA